jgi:hypothetical protein
MRRCKRQARGRSNIAGFTLIEALISTLLMVAILSALAVVTAQWMPNWNRGFAHVQHTEFTARGLERIVADLTAAEFIPPSGDAKGPLFDGAALSVTLVRSALGPNTRPGLEFVRIGETADDRGLAMVRVRALRAARIAGPRSGEILRSGRAGARALPGFVRLRGSGSDLARFVARRRQTPDCHSRDAARCGDGAAARNLDGRHHSRQCTGELIARKGSQEL